MKKHRCISLLLCEWHIILSAHFTAGSKRLVCIYIPNIGRGKGSFFIMDKYKNVLLNVELFNGIDENNISSMLSCLEAQISDYNKNEFILREGDPVNYVGIVLDGQLQIIREDANGERILITGLNKGDIFGEALSSANVTHSPVSVVSYSDSKVLVINFQRILKVCSSACSHHTKLIENMLHLLAQKNLFLQNRMNILSKKTIRSRILCYFDSVVFIQGHNNINIPFNREELADFLCTDRSALSRELANMKAEGIIDYYKNYFKLL